MSGMPPLSAHFHWVPCLAMWVCDPKPSPMSVKVPSGIRVTMWPIRMKPSNKETPARQPIHAPGTRSERDASKKRREALLVRRENE